MEIVSIVGQPKKETGKAANGKLRKTGQVPCVIYGGDEQVMFSSNFLDMRALVYTPDFKLAEIEVEGKKYKAILKDIQFDPVTDQMVHADFQLLKDGHTVKVEVPVRFNGIASGVKAGGTLVAKLRKVKIMATPEKLINEVNINVSEVELGSSVRVSDIDVEDGVVILNNPSIPVASVEIPRALKSAASEEAKEGEDAEAPAEAEA